jgi:hypothetical protein
MIIIFYFVVPLSSPLPVVHASSAARFVSDVRGSVGGGSGRSDNTSARAAA